ncbi:uncharacterized protein F4822DRAFT_434509 [Hypoxylon trugodes]|uniref:uncharacterized protein n=1 Tax=Hypoxylon trugodes TaxID=326681 RepID=UPI00219F8C42|nr:uncharacterized protein F4822DRAFT_434509 [Hypoxylon trugodes]KAI1383388.1 hypothetical protein F4822DRAFT_434509 [Hypoxylon trugodes]
MDPDKYFAILAPCEFKCLTRSTWDLSDWMFSGKASLLVGLLAVPVLSHQRQRNFTSKLKNELPRVATAHGTSRITIWSLPTEIHLMILDQVDEYDCACFGLTHIYFWQLALPVLHDKWASSMAPWAGKKIVASGIELEPGDFPNALFSIDEAVTLVLSKFHSNLDRIQTMYVDPIGQLSLRELLTLFDFFNLSDEQPIITCESKLESLKSVVRKRGHTVPHEGLSTCFQANELTEFTEEDFYPRNEPWILRNLTKREFVRSEAIALKPEYVRGPVIELVGFGEALLSRICWSSNPDVAIDRGPWAGHRFDIITLSRHAATTRKEDWIDVSEEVSDSLHTIWNANCTPEWQDFVTDRSIEIQEGAVYNSSKVLPLQATAVRF